MAYEFAAILAMILFFSVSIGKELAEKTGIDMAYHATLTFILCIAVVIFIAHQ